MCNELNIEHMHRILYRPPTITYWVGTFDWLMSVWNQTHNMFWVTCLFRFWRKNSHALVDSLSTTTKAIKRILLLTSCAIATRRVPLYLPYNHVPLTWNMDLQYWNPLIHCLKLQKRWWNMMKPSIGWPPCGSLAMFSSPPPY